ncbi:hypothetical protein EVAR_45387_1 [Eumeta japonica]|uniref:G-protein coupled receptors family 2 profile 1 domain-containing protein n=1 Tax=Eumeta variegata TaxID=151549 RepID=A0A4C1WTZ9_EUMVA|nr:hypothetical protein EVAR_45387_1 [Eumeta japonica]
MVNIYLYSGEANVCHAYYEANFVWKTCWRREANDKAKWKKIVEAKVEAKAKALQPFVEAYSNDVWRVMQDDEYFWNQYDVSSSKSRSENALSCIRPDFYICEPMLEPARNMHLRYRWKEEVMSHAPQCPVQSEWDDFQSKIEKHRITTSFKFIRVTRLIHITFRVQLPPNVGLPESTRTCNYRSVNFQEQVYRWVAGHGCLFYTPNFLYVAGVNNISMTTGCRYGHLSAPCVEVAKEDGTCGCYPFDPDFEEVVTVVRHSLVQSAHERWERCVQTAVDCCMDIMIHDTEYPEGHCPSTFDAWTCWDTAPNGTVQSEVCSQFAYSNSGPTCNLTGDHLSACVCDAVCYQWAFLHRPIRLRNGPGSEPTPSSENAQLCETVSHTVSLVRPGAYSTTDESCCEARHESVAMA